MLDETIIQKRLRDLGVKESRIMPMMQEVGQIIIGRALLALTEKLTSDERKEFSNLQPDQIEAYLADHQEIVPLSQEHFDAIHDQAWEECFKAMR